MPDNSGWLLDYLNATPQELYPPDPQQRVPGLGHAMRVAGQYYDVPTQANLAEMSGMSALGRLALALQGALNAPGSTQQAAQSQKATKIKKMKNGR